MEGNKQNWRLSVQLTTEQEKALIELRKKKTALDHCRQHNADRMGGLSHA